MTLGAKSVAAVFVLVALLSSGCKRHTETWPASMKTLAPAAVVHEVRAAKGSPVLLVLYASWCHSCRSELPDIEALATRHRAEGLKLLAYSLDDDPNDFAEMLHERSYSFDFVRLAPPDGPALPRALDELGGSFRGAIPYVAVFDRQGKMLKDFTGGAAPAVLDPVVLRALQGKPAGAE